LVEVLRGLPLDRLTSFTLENKWAIFDYRVGEVESTPFLPSITSCIDDICAGRMLQRLDLDGQLPFLRLISRCGPALEELRAARLQHPSPIGSGIPRSYLPMERRGTINLKLLTIPHEPPSFLSNGPSRPGKDNVMDYLFDPRSLFNLRSIQKLEILGLDTFSERSHRLFESCSESLECLIIRSLRTFSTLPFSGSNTH
jgi:hypothetical protein